MNDRALLSNLDFTLEPGQWTALLGPSGIGKSSLLRLIAGLPTPLKIDGSTLLPNPNDISWMAQDDLLLPWKSVLQNIQLGATLRGEPRDQARAEKLLSAVGLAGFGPRSPTTLSGGERQRVALARTLMEARALVLLDEPFSALDPKTRIDVQDLARRLLEGRTVLMITHDPLEAARLADTAFLMTRAGLRHLPLPTVAHPRQPEDQNVATVQAQMYAELRAL
ncbi:MAG: ABC transporter ATP-binding protein [Pseudomonadota bacterium]